MPGGDLKPHATRSPRRADSAIEGAQYRLRDQQHKGTGRLDDQADRRSHREGLENTKVTEDVAGIYDLDKLAAVQNNGDSVIEAEEETESLFNWQVSGFGMQGLHATPPPI